MRVCWCGNDSLAPFSASYGECAECGTLVSLQGMSLEELQVRDDEDDFYGKQYWLNHQSADLGFPDIHTRARADLTERNLHWLKALLKYKLPPASVMEIGCSHGSFVGLLNLAGYEAQGVELSPWVVDFGRRAFGVPISVGPVENLSVAKGSLDAIALMDVLEHLPDPAATMAHCLELLKPDGLLLVQTPQFREGMQYADLQETKGPFLEQLKADEHLFLLTDRAARRLFKQLGAPHICFEPAIFSQYDMFFAVSRQPLHAWGDDETEAALLSSPGGRMALALLDMRRHSGKLDSAIAELTQYKASADEQVRTLTEWLLESRAANESLTRRQSDIDGRIESLTAMLLASQVANAGLAADKSDAESRIQALTFRLNEAQDENHALGKANSTAASRIEHLATELAEAAHSLSNKEQHQSDLEERIESLTAMLLESQVANAGLAADNSDAESRIQALTFRLNEAQDEIHALGKAKSAAASRIEQLATELAEAAHLLSNKEQLLNGRIVRMALATSRVLHRLFRPRIPGARK